MTMINIEEHRAPEIKRGDRTYVPVARTWRVGFRGGGYSYTVPHRIEVASPGKETEWIRIPDPQRVIKLVAGLVMGLGLARRLMKG
ncbi:MAG: hypothetical protein ACE5MI_04905 [Acidimicrobiia bacterium]